MPKLTDTLVKRLPVPTSTKKTITRDSEVSRFMAQVTRDGCRSFIIRYSVNRRERLHTIGKFPDWPTETARNEAKRLLQLVDQGVDPARQIGGALSVEQVRHLLWSSGTLREPERLPDDAEARLTQRLNAVHYFFVVDDALSPANAAKRNAIDWIEAARRELGKLLKVEHMFLVHAESATSVKNVKFADIARLSAEGKRDELKLIMTADNLLRHVTTMPVFRARYSTGQPQRWTAHADTLFDALKEALESVPGKPLGRGTRAGRFIEAVVPLLTGERVTAGAAVKQLKRMRQESEHPNPDIQEVLDDINITEVVNGDLVN